MSQHRRGTKRSWWIGIVLVTCGLALAAPAWFGALVAGPRADTLDKVSSVPDRARGLWIGPSELAALPTSGEAWERLRTRAESDIGKADIADQDSRHGIDTLAVALVAARSGDPRLRAKAIANLLEVIGTDDNHDSHCDHKPNRARSLAIGRNLAAYVIAADVLGLRADRDPDSSGSLFAAWVDMVRHKDNCPNTGSGSWPEDNWFDLSQSHDQSGSNGAAMAGGARLAAALYLGDTAEVEAAWATFRRYSGDRSVGPDLSFNDDGLTWAADPEAPVAINPKGATRDGHRIDGAIINDQGRGGSFRWPPRYTSYPWEGLQGYYLQAALLARAGYPAWEVVDRAPLRALDYQYYLDRETDQDKWWGERAEWVKYLANSVYGTDYPISGHASGGRNMAWTDWTHGSGGAATSVSPTPTPTAAPGNG